MASRPTLVAETDAAPSSRRSKAAEKTGGMTPTQATGQTRATTIYCDVAATVRWSLFGLAAVLFALAFFVIAWRGGSNYPTTTGIQAIGVALSAASGKPTTNQRK